MKLHAGHLLEHLQKKNVLLMFPDQMPRLSSPKDRDRQKIFGSLIEDIEKAQKYIFDSGSDKDPKQMDAVRNSATVMMDFDLFHLPFPNIWVEDPFEDNPDERRYYFHMKEDAKARTITINFFARMPEYKKDGFTYTYCPFPFTKDLDITTDKWAWQAPDPKLFEGTPIWDMFVQPYREAMYASTKFLVTLRTANHLQERDPGKPFKARIPQQFREYPHVIVRIPDDPSYGQGQGTGEGKRRRMHLVEGYVWGKNTRPVTEQRPIDPHWRGSQEVGVIERGHTVVRSRQAK